MDLTRTGDVVGLCIGILTLLGIVFGWLRVVRPRWRRAWGRVGAALDTIAGREAITDNITGRELAPELPSIGKRMETVEGGMTRLIEIIESQRHQDQRLDAHEARLDGHDESIKQLTDQTIERIAAKAESVSAWRAVEAVAKNVDHPTTPEIDG